jgi:hypothetical protein
VIRIEDRERVRPVGQIRGYVSFGLLLVGVVSWRQKAYFTGGIDPVVVGKAIIVALALMFALTIPRRVMWERIPMSALVLLGLYSVETALGGGASQDLFAASVLSIRLLLTAAVVLVLAAKTESFELFTIMRNTMIALALVSMATGSTASGRLSGGIPPLTPNELALLCGVSVLSIAWTCLNGKGNFVHAALFVVLFGVVYLTGSRTGLGLLIVAVLAMVVQARRIPLAAFVASVALIPTAFYIIGSTGLVSSFVDRGGSGNVTTLSSRTIAWTAAFHRGGGLLQQLLGGGLALKQIPVSGQYWNQQILDSTWISALVQGGYIGIVLLVVWCVIALRGAFRAARPERLLWTGLLIFVVGRSGLESGMLDSSSAFLVFFVISIVSRAPTQARPELSPPTENRTAVLPKSRASLTGAGRARVSVGAR